MTHTDYHKIPVTVLVHLVCVWQIVGWVSVYSQCSDPRVLVYVRAASDQHRGQRRPDITQNKAADSLDLASINVLAPS